jgi:hypothetical protein
MHAEVPSPAGAVEGRGGVSLVGMQDASASTVAAGPAVCNCQGALHPLLLYWQ